MNDDPTVWLLIDDRAGNRGQVMGVAEALGRRYLIQDLEYTAAGALPNFVIGASFAGLTRNSRVNLAAPWPDLVIAAGRRTAPVARHIKGLNDGNTFLCQIMFPGEAGLDEFDLIVVPRHDAITPRDNVLTITGAPHRVTAGALALAAREWAGRFDPLPTPRVALIVGGSTKRRDFTADMARELARRASALVGAGSLLVTTSRRTTPEAAEALARALTVPNQVYRWGDSGANPYMGYLALADGVVVTGDSVSMCCEACATPGPVWIHAPRRLTVHKHAKLHRELFEAGAARPLDEGTTFAAWTHAPVNAAAAVAAAIGARMGRSPVA